MKRTLMVSALIVLPFVMAAQTIPDSFKQGLLQYKSHDHVQALSSFTEALDADPSFAKAWFYRGLTRQALGEISGALSDVNQAISLEADEPNMLLRRAELLAAIGQRQRARNDLERVIVLVPDGAITIHALFSLGSSYVEESDYKQAAETYAKVLELTPEDAWAWFNHGIAMAHLDDYASAIRDQSRALELDPNLSPAYASRAIGYIMDKQKDKACPDLKRAMELGESGVEELLAIYCE